MEAKQILNRLKQRINEHIAMYDRTIDKALKDEQYSGVSFAAGSRDAYVYMRYYIEYLEKGEL